MEKRYYIHESSYIDEPVSIGEGTKIWHFCHIMKNSKIGRNCVLGQNVNIDGGVVIGDNVKIQNNVSVYKKVTLEDDVFCGPSMVFTNVLNPRSTVPRNIDEYASTLVKRGTSIGANATVLCGLTIGEYAFIGAGSVVTKNVPSYALVYGSPAQQHGWMCQCGTRFIFEGNLARCEDCRREYQFHDDRVEVLGD